MIIRYITLVIASIMYLQALALDQPSQLSCDQQTVACKQIVMHNLENCQARHHSLQANTTICRPSYRLETETCYQRRKQCQNQQHKQQLLAMTGKITPHY